MFSILFNSKFSITDISKILIGIAQESVVIILWKFHLFHVSYIDAAMLLWMQYQRTLSFCLMLKKYGKLRNHSGIVLLRKHTLVMKEDSSGFSGYVI